MSCGVIVVLGDARLFICSPHFYYGEEVQDSINRVTTQAAHQWIYNLAAQFDEEIYLDEEEWVLAKDKHPGNDLRYLIIFKDRNLKTLRDLRACHLHMLRYVQERSIKAVAQIHGLEVKMARRQWRIFFHYYPSVFQLHAHIVAEPVMRNADRMHDIRHVMRNLEFSSTWYRDALLLCTHSRFVNHVLHGACFKRQAVWHRWSKHLINSMRIELITSFLREADPVEINLPFVDPSPTCQKAQHVCTGDASEDMVKRGGAVKDTGMNTSS